MAARFWVGGTGTWDASDTTHWSDSSGGAGGQSVPGSSDTVTFDGSSGGGTVTVNTNFNVTSVTMGAFTGTLDLSANNNSPTMQTFSVTGTGVRTLNLGSGTFTLTGNAATIWDGATTTNLTFSVGTSIVKCTYSGSTGTRTISTTSNNIINLWVSAGTDSVTISNSVGDLDWTGFAGTWNSNSLDVYSNLTLGAGMVINQTGSTSVNMRAASGSKTITVNGVAFDRNLNIGTSTTSTATFTLADNIVIRSSSTLTLTSGTFDANNRNITCGTFSSSNSNTRTLTMGSGTWTLTGNAAAIWNISTGINLTFTNTTANIVCNYSGGTGTRTISSVVAGSVQATLSAPRLLITGGSDVVAFNANSAPSFQSIDFTGFSGSVIGPTTSFSIRDNLILSPTMTFSLSGMSGSLSFIGNSNNITQGTFTTNGKTIDVPILFSGSGGSWILGSNLTATGTVTLTQGTFNAGGYNVTCSSFASSNSNTRTLTMGSGTWTLTGTGTVWNTATTTNLTFNANTSTIKVNNASSSSKTLALGSLTYYNLHLTGDGSGVIQVGTTTTTNTFNNITIDTGPKTVSFFAGGTINGASFTATGTPGSLVTLQSTTASIPWNLTDSSGANSCNYVVLTDSRATGGASFYAGANSVDGGGNTGWQFTGAPPNTGLLALF